MKEKSLCLMWELSKFNHTSLPLCWFWLVLRRGVVDDGEALALLEAFGPEEFGFSLNPSLLQKMFQLLFVVTSFSISFFMLRHSFSSSETRSLISSTATISSCVVLLLGRARFPLGSWEVSKLSETKNHPAMDVRRRSCSKNRTWTMSRSGSLSFWAAWVLASNESFWQFTSLQISSLSESVSHGCAWMGKTILAKSHK